MMKLDLEGQDPQPTCSYLEILKKHQQLDLGVGIMVPYLFFLGEGLSCGLAAWGSS